MQGKLPELKLHKMHVTVKDHNTESTLLIDNENVFNSINSKVMLHNMKLFAWSLLHRYVTNVL